MITCKLCQAAGCSTLLPRGPRTFHSCPSCGLAFVPDSEWLSLDDERARYQHHDNTPDNHGYVGFLNEVVEQADALNLGDRPILDFGSGEHAVLTGLLNARGLVCTAYDPLYGRTQLAGPYALVVVCEVIEHLRDLRGELVGLRDRLLPDGKILVRTQPIPSVERISSWWYSRDPTHINFFSEDSLAYAASLLGRTSTRLAKDIFLWTWREGER
jgi:Methyltransferase domain